MTSRAPRRSELVVSAGEHCWRALLRFERATHAGAEGA
jgi:hypothetical protein